MAKITSTPTSYSVFREGDSPVFGESVIIIRLEDEAGGEFITIEQDTEEHGHQRLWLDFGELDEIARVINKLRKESTERNRK